MKTQNIVVCNDLRCKDLDEQLAKGKKLQLSGDGLWNFARESANFDGELCKSLRENGHNVVLFDGHAGSEFRDQVIDPVTLANNLEELIVEHGFTCMVLDLNWFGDFDLGIKILRKLIHDNCIPKEMRNQVLIYSRFTNEPGRNYVEILVDELRVSRENIFNRNYIKIDHVVEVVGNLG